MNSANSITVHIDNYPEKIEICINWAYNFINNLALKYLL